MPAPEVPAVGPTAEPDAVGAAATPNTAQATTDGGDGATGAAGPPPPPPPPPAAADRNSASRRVTRGSRMLTYRDLTYYTYEGDPHPAVVALAETTDADGNILLAEYITWKDTLLKQGWTYTNPLEGTFYFVPSDDYFKSRGPDAMFPDNHVDVVKGTNRHQRCIGGYNMFRELYQLKEIVFKLQGGGELEPQ